jgi:hypothetical protein
VRGGTKGCGVRRRRLWSDHRESGRAVLGDAFLAYSFGWTVALLLGAAGAVVIIVQVILRGDPELQPSRNDDYDDRPRGLR